MKSEPIALANVEIAGGFWDHFGQLARDVILPYQWDVMNDRVKGVPKSGVINNFKLAGKKKAGQAKKADKFHGMRFQDSDLGKWLEAVAYRLITHPDAKLEKTVDKVIDLVEAAQLDDGYLDTYYMLGDIDNRWTNVRDNHEMYVAGHMLEGAIAYFDATGKRKFLDVMIRNVEHIAKRFGKKKGQLPGYPGHQELELALVKLYRNTGEQKYLDLAKYFIDERGQAPSYFDVEKKARNETKHWVDSAGGLEYFQGHEPVRKQDVAVGHAVRCMYMAIGATDVAKETKDKGLYKSMKTLWRNVVDTQMYIIGGVGSTGHGEAFSYDYDLPNETSYAETCAAIALAIWAQRMQSIEVDGEYGDVMERALYNNIIAGVSRDGKHFFYANPLASVPHPRKPGDAIRPGWYECACCPPNLARIVTSLGSYAYGQSAPRDKTLFVHLFAGSKANFQVAGTEVTLTQKTEYPWRDTVKMTVSPAVATKFQLAIRMPAWCKAPKVSVNGKAVSLAKIVKKGYAYIDREWKKGDRVEVKLPMPAERVYSHPSVRADVGRVALQRGPVVYCLEQADNDDALHAVALPRDAKLTIRREELDGICDKGEAIPVIQATGERLTSADGAGLTAKAPKGKKVKLKAVPYYLWANRGEGEMLVWMRETL